MKLFKELYRQLLTEETKGVIFTFGRFQPFTIGHEENINELIQLGKKYNYRPQIYTSQTNDKDKNPLPFALKIKVIKQLFPIIYVSTDDKLKSPYQVLQKLSDAGEKNVIFVVGDDRVEDFEKQIKKYIPDTYKFDNFKVISSGNRTEGISGTKVRELARKGEKDKFIKLLPKKIQNTKLSDEIYDSINNYK